MRSDFAAVFTRMTAFISPRLPHAIGLAVLLLSGCKYDGSVMQMNSDSPMPFFGLQLSVGNDRQPRNNARPQVPVPQQLAATETQSAADSVAAAEYRTAAAANRALAAPTGSPRPSSPPQPAAVVAADYAVLEETEARTEPTAADTSPGFSAHAVPGSRIAATGGFPAAGVVAANYATGLSDGGGDAASQDVPALNVGGREQAGMPQTHPPRAPHLLPTSSQSEFRGRVRHSLQRVRGASGTSADEISERLNGF